MDVPASSPASDLKAKIGASRGCSRRHHKAGNANDGDDMGRRPQNGRSSLNRTAADDPRWARVLARDKTADGQFWYSVATTGIYCRPSCPSRTANPKNVQLHDTLDGARATGFRPCKRCNPDGPSIEGRERRDRRPGLPPHRGERGRAVAGASWPRRPDGAPAISTACSRPSPG